jgi:hypothetical protein
MRTAPVNFLRLTLNGAAAGEGRLKRQGPASRCGRGPALWRAGRDGRERSDQPVRPMGSATIYEPLFPVRGYIRPTTSSVASCAGPQLTFALGGPGFDGR